jgi:hypothetical protein
MVFYGRSALIPPCPRWAYIASPRGLKLSALRMNFTNDLVSHRCVSRGATEVSLFPKNYSAIIWHLVGTCNGTKWISWCQTVGTNLAPTWHQVGASVAPARFGTNYFTVNTPRSACEFGTWCHEVPLLMSLVITEVPTWCQVGDTMLMTWCQTVGTTQVQNMDDPPRYAAII